MSDPIPPQQPYTPPYTNTPYTDIPNAGPAGYPPPQGYAPQGGYPPPAGYPPAAASSGLSTNSAAALAYVTIIPAIVFLVLEPYNKIPLVRFHAIQCLALTAVWVGLQICLTILAIILHVIPLIGMLIGLVHLAVGLAMFIGWLACIIKASKGEWFKLPVIGDFALKQAQS
ncbi:DUF4870 domain-containing protein [Granulicella arctica]|uniref:DUF4870 domain-containing protein n=1 Tax=Granulicella arctica TaxID=940613 RepID=UPI0021E084E8|nr:DUF4870 domain-containing protein [Granulicella arctica]